MAELYKAIYYMRPNLTYDYWSMDTVPESLDKPWHYIYSNWECIAKDFDANNLEDWKAIAKSQNQMFTIDLLHPKYFVAPDHAKHNKPKHPVHYWRHTVYWLKEDGKTIPPARIAVYRKRYKENLNKNAQEAWDKIEENNRTQMPYKHCLRHPKTTSAKRRDLTPEEKLEIKDTYRVCIPNIKIEASAYDDIYIPKYKSWKNNTKQKKRYNRRKPKTRRGHKLIYQNREP